MARGFGGGGDTPSDVLMFFLSQGATAASQDSRKAVHRPLPDR